MGECVVRMEMPKNCWVCPFGLDGYIWDENDARTHYVRFCSRHSGEEYHVLETDDSDRPWYCDSFICQLPEGHGRLVDIDRKFLRVANNGHGMSWNWRGSIADMIDKDNMRGVEIIVPAERREE